MDVALVASCTVSAASARYKRAAIAGPEGSRTRAAELLVSTTLHSRFSLASNAIASVRRFDVSASDYSQSAFSAKTEKAK
jgi:hypothetical protein